MPTASGKSRKANTLKIRQREPQAALADLRAPIGNADEVPDGWYTAEELASEAGCSHATALRMIRKPTGKLYPTPYYRPKAKS